MKKLGQLICLLLQSCLRQRDAEDILFPLSRLGLGLGHGTLEMGTVRRKSRQQDLGKRKERPFYTTSHTHTRARARTYTHTDGKIKAENLAKWKNPTLVPSKLILGQEVIAKDPNKKPTAGCKWLQVFN